MDTTSNNRTNSTGLHGGEKEMSLKTPRGPAKPLSKEDPNDVIIHNGHRLLIVSNNPYEDDLL